MAYQKDKKRFHGKFSKNIFDAFKSKAKKNGYYLSGKLNDLLKEYIQNNELLNLEFQRNENEKTSKSVYLEKELDIFLDKFKNNHGIKKIEVLESLMEVYIDEDKEVAKFKGHQSGKIQSSYNIDHDLYDKFSKKANADGKAVVDEFNKTVKKFLKKSDGANLNRLLNDPNINFKKEKYNIFIEPKLKETLKKKSEKCEVNMSDIINAALYDYI